jgi:hypothetical protein
MYLQNDRLTAAAEELRRGLTENAAASGREWAIRIGRALSDVERILRRHAADVSTTDDAPADQDRALLPSPGVERRAEGLRHELDVLIESLRTLRTELAAGRENPPGSGTVGFSERVQGLLRALEHLDQGEIDLVQESITADIGAGD